MGKKSHESAVKCDVPKKKHSAAKSVKHFVEYSAYTHMNRQNKAHILGHWNNIR